MRSLHFTTLVTLLALTGIAQAQLLNLNKPFKLPASTASATLPPAQSPAIKEAPVITVFMDTAVEKEAIAREAAAKSASMKPQTPGVAKNATTHRNATATPVQSACVPVDNTAVMAEITRRAAKLEQEKRLLATAQAQLDRQRAELWQQQQDFLSLQQTTQNAKTLSSPEDFKVWNK